MNGLPWGWAVWFATWAVVAWRSYESIMRRARTKHPNDVEALSPIVVAFALLWPIAWPTIMAWAFIELTRDPTMIPRRTPAREEIEMSFLGYDDDGGYVEWHVLPRPKWWQLRKWWAYWRAREGVVSTNGRRITVRVVKR